MTSKMLIDATHPEETRLVVLRGERVEEFDFESAARKLLRGNIYLAKVTRVEPSLQAAFVEYGGNRHGFLAFSDIHPDYYQIPVADRQALLEAEAAAAEEEEARYERPRGRRRQRNDRDRRRGGEHRGEADRHPGPAEGQDTEALSTQPDDRPPYDTVGSEPVLPLEAAAADVIREDYQAEPQRSEPDGSTPELRPADELHGAAGVDAAAEEAPSDAPRDTGHQIGLIEDEGVEEVDEAGDGDEEAESIEEVGSEDVMEEVPERRRRPVRQYKIQEVIRRRQILLVQVVKEERGNKGAALTTYLSLAGRYTVLMPNSGRGGGISRKITNAVDRKRLKEIATDLEVPEGMGLIVRTAGAAHSRQEIKRDFEYLLRLWESVRDLTLRSTAPALVYEEGDLIRRSLRDLYSEDIGEVVVAGERVYEEARDFMRMLMPSHARNVKLYDEAEPLFSRFPVERQLAGIYSPYVTLRSGGYIVINQTEALVSIDVNSGKSTREHSIEDTALATNVEAADEIARQLRLRDLAGLIVIDFIDMEERRNNRHVERRLKEALRHDRARIQVGRISHFGLMEMSRQRLRTGVVEGSTSQCPHCLGTGIIRSTESVALTVLRALEEKLQQGSRHNVTASMSIEAALYILNEKRDALRDMESRYGISITVAANDKLHGANFTIERGALSTRPVAERKPRGAVQMDWAFAEGEEAVGEPALERDEDADAVGDAPIAAELADEAISAREGAEGDGRRGGRRRRRRRGGRGGERGEAGGEPRLNGNGRDHGRDDVEARVPGAEEDDEPELSAGDTEADAGSGDADGPEGAGGAETGEGGDRRRSRRRGRRGGRRNRRGERGAPGEGVSRLDTDASDLVAVAYEDSGRDEAGRQPQPADDDEQPFGQEARNGGSEAHPMLPGPEAEIPSGPGYAGSSDSFAEAPIADERAPRDAGTPVYMTPPPPPEPELQPLAAAATEPVPPPVVEPPLSGPPRRGWWQKRM